MSPANRTIKRILLCVFLMPASWSSAAPGDDRIEAYLRENQMDQLLEVQLEARLERADSGEERAEISRALSELYLRQLRSIDRGDPYRDVVLGRARSLVERAGESPMYELRLELLVDAFVSSENAIELHQLGLLEDGEHRAALSAMTETRRGLTRLLAETVPEEDRLTRRRTSARTTELERELSDEINLLRRMNSFGNYYLGWSGYGVAVLEDRHVENGTYEAFGWLLGAEGGIPQSRDLRLAALEYEHVARSAIGVAMCYAQSEGYQFADAWLSELLEQDEISQGVRDAALLRQLRVHVLSDAWYDALLRATQIRSDSDPAVLPVADARFVVLQTLESRRSSGDSDAEKLVQGCIADLVEQREIGHIVDLYQRFERIPLLGNGFIPNYARALAELERVEQEQGAPNYMSVAELLSRALKAEDVSEYPEHRDDCRLKLAYVYVRADRPRLALEQCTLVLDTSLDREALEEARWLRIAALDHENMLAGRSTSPQLEDAIRLFIDTQPASDRTRTLVLRYATRGLIDERLALDTLRSVPEGDPDAIAARRLQVQLQYKLLRRSGFTDASLLRETRSTIARLLEQESPDTSPESVVSTLQIGIDLALRDEPPEPDVARRYIEQARSIVGGRPGLERVEPELITQLIRTALLQSRLDEAMGLLDQLRAIDPGRAEEGRVLILNTVIDRWEKEPSIKTARNLIEIAAPVLARTTPRAPERIGIQQSALIETVAHAGGFIHSQEPDEEMRELAMRLSKQVLERGQPSERGLRRTATLAGETMDTQTELDAWLRLLAAYQEDDERWFEARYHSLVAMQRIDPDRARETFEQFRTLNPTLGPPPWGERIASLFAENGAGNSGGGAP